MAEPSSAVRRPLRIICCAAAVVAVLSGCTVPAGTKVGSGVLPVVLTIGTPERGDDMPYLDDLDLLAQIVDERSDGAMRLEVTKPTARFTPDAEVILGRTVAQGGVDLALLPTRAFTALGIDRFQPLEAPFLITSDDVGAAVARDPLLADMLQEVGAGRVGIGVLFETIRRPVGYPRPLLGTRAFRGATLRVGPSAVTAETLHAFGAQPVMSVSYLDHDGTPITGADSAFAWYDSLPDDAVIAANIALSAKFDAIVASQSAWNRLDAGQRGVLVAAVAALSAEGGSTAEDEDAERYCESGRTVAFAEPADVAALRALSEPVVVALAENPQAAADLAAIRRIVETTPDAALDLPHVCESPTGDSAPWPDTT